MGSKCRQQHPQSKEEEKWAALATVARCIRRAGGDLTLSAQAKAQSGAVEANLSSILARAVS